MVKTNDPLLEVFRHRQDPAVREKLMLELEGRQVTKKERIAAKQAAKMQSRPTTKPDPFIALVVPESVTPGQKATVRLTHHFPAALVGTTIKDTLQHLQAKPVPVLMK